MRFADVIGQDAVKQRLLLAVREGRVPHAQLFTGPDGVGKLPLAIAYATYLVCPEHLEGDACGVCPTCLQYGKLQHPDLHFIFPIVKKDVGDTCDDYVALFRDMLLTNPYADLDDWYQQLGIETKQGVIYEKESGEILRKLSLKSFSDGYRVVIIWQPEKMNNTCANKLLKLLEEPPEKTLFLLVSDHPEQLLPTIVSRTQEIRVPRLTKEDIVSGLEKYYPNSDRNKFADWARIANGSLIRAMHMAREDEQTQQFFTDFVALMRNAWLVSHKTSHKFEALQALRKWSLDIADSKVGREKQKAFLQYVQGQIRENFIANYNLENLNYMTTEERDFSTNFARFIHAGNVDGIMDELSRAEQQITQNGNAKIIFFDLCLQMIVKIKL